MTTTKPTPPATDPADPVPAIRKAHARHEELSQLIKAAHTAYDLVLHATPAGTHEFWVNIAHAETALADLYTQRAQLDPGSVSANNTAHYYRGLATESADRAASYAAEAERDLGGEDGDKPATADAPAGTEVTA